MHRIALTKKRQLLYNKNTDIVNRFTNLKEENMKRILSVLLALAAAISLSVAAVGAEGGNLLNNGDFNSGALGGWWMRADWNGGTWAYSETEGYEGRRLPDRDRRRRRRLHVQCGAVLHSGGGQRNDVCPHGRGAVPAFFYGEFSGRNHQQRVHGYKRGRTGLGAANHTGGWRRCPLPLPRPAPTRSKSGAW